MFGGLPPAPRWAWIVMALSVVAIAVMSYLVVNRPPPPGFTAPAAAEAPAAADEAPAEELEELRLLVIGDGTTATAADEPGWPQLLADDLREDGRPVELTVQAATGAGYLKTPPGGATFGSLAEAGGSEFDVVVFFGSRDDIEAAPEVRAAAESVFAAAQAAAPEAELLAIGPAWPTADPPGYIETNRDAVAAAAADAGVRFVDPLVAGWLADPARAEPGRVAPTPAGHRYLADQVRPLVEELVPADG
ncbi:SGNH/GDSL hydrolase family protein [Blastococcus saxobsidens]|uniref:SGNH/GDSL hydrolase family protein n=1 Tax=Blastococcus saxobsidens TaxID=138336 RepID=A0A6L9VYJ1_9ACTN|nr:GDSL-type esterase/lipase family protein [Blastococcus saxobsidens]NEK84240.1 SGNH/GDSL hydrolase family protein [Blastococcus saxobsidens]